MPSPKRRRKFLAPLGLGPLQVEQALKDVPDEFLIEWVRQHGYAVATREQAIGLICFELGADTSRIVAEYRAAGSAAGGVATVEASPASRRAGARATDQEIVKDGQIDVDEDGGMDGQRAGGGDGQKDGAKDGRKDDRSDGSGDGEMAGVAGGRMDGDKDGRKDGGTDCARDGGQDVGLVGAAEGELDVSQDGETDGAGDGGTGGSMDGSTDGERDGGTDETEVGGQEREWIAVGDEPAQTARDATPPAAEIDGDTDGAKDGEKAGGMDGGLPGHLAGDLDGDRDGEKDGLVDGDTDRGSDGATDDATDGAQEVGGDADLDGGKDGELGAPADGGVDGGLPAVGVGGEGGSSGGPRWRPIRQGNQRGGRRVATEASTAVDEAMDGDQDGVKDAELDGPRGPVSGAITPGARGREVISRRLAHVRRAIARAPFAAFVQPQSNAVEVHLLGQGTLRVPAKVDLRRERRPNGVVAGLKEWISGRLAVWAEFSPGGTKGRVRSQTTYLRSQELRLLQRLEAELGLPQYKIVGLALEVLGWFLSRRLPVPETPPERPVKRLGVGLIELPVLERGGERRNFYMPVPTVALVRVLAMVTEREISDVINVAINAFGALVFPAE